MPYDTGTEIPFLSYLYINEDESDDELEDEGAIFRHYNLSDDAISINDERSSTPQDKIVRLKELFLKSGYEIEVINQI